MPGPLEFDRDLYRRAARYYDRFRVPYSVSLIEDLLSRVRPSGRGRLLDLACGTGQVTFPIAGQFAEIWAVDQEPEMIELVGEKALACGIKHVTPVVSPAEDLVAPPGAFELVAIGNAFHRLRRETVSTKAFTWLQPGGWIALLWSSSPWDGTGDWQASLAAVLNRWRRRLGVEARVPADWDRPRAEHPDVAVLSAAGFEPAGSYRFPMPHDWTLGTLVGFIYSTSSLPLSVLGDRATEFEADIRRELRGYTIDGRLSGTIDFGYELARRPPPR